jgi:hypothetical protein
VPLGAPVTSVVVVACAGTATPPNRVTDSVTRCAFASSLCSWSSIVTSAGAEISGGVTAPPARMTNAAGMRTLVFGAVGLLCFGALLFGTSGGRELVVAVVVVGPRLTVLVAVVGLVAGLVLAAVFVLVAGFALVGVVGEEAALLAELDELEEGPAPPQAAISNEASAVAQSACRGIGAL